MPKFECIFGHVEADPRKPGQMRPIVHASRSRCAIYRQLYSAGKIDASGRYKPGFGPTAASTAPAPPAGGETPAPGAPAAESPAEPSPPATPAKEGLLKRLSTGLQVRFRRVETTPPLPPGSAAGDTDWEISEDTSEQFFTIIHSFIEVGCNMLTTYLEIPNVPKDAFEVDPGQSFIYRKSLRGFATNILKKVFLAKSPEHAEQIVAGLSGVLGFGMMGMKIAIHLLLHAPKSPKIIRLRARMAENRAKGLQVREERERMRAAQEEERRRALPPGARGAPG